MTNDKCDKGFGSKDRLKNHKNTHDNHKQFVCSVCKKGYNQRVHLKTHMMSHTGEKPYKCLYCEKSFINLQKTNLHKKQNMKVTEPNTNAKIVKELSTDLLIKKT